MFWKVSYIFLKVHVFGSIFSLDSTLRQKTVLSSITILNKYCKATLNLFFKEKYLMWKKNCLYDRFFVSNQSFTT